MLSLGGAELNENGGLGRLCAAGKPGGRRTQGIWGREPGKSEPPDLPRERTDRAILEHAFAEKKPVLAICYGCQLLNVFLGGTLIQDLRSETGTTIAHRKKDIWPMR